MNGWLKIISEPVTAPDFGLDLAYPGLSDLLPVAIVCGVSILLTALWILATSGYSRPKDKDLARPLEQVHPSG
jgi:hypothetical protein